MTPDQQQLVRSSWSAVEPIADEAATMFYSRVFELDPSLRRLFGYSDMARQRAILMQTLAVVVRSIDRLDEMTPELEALGRRHVGYGVEVEDYATVGSAVLWALESSLGDAFIEEIALAWAAAYRRLSSVMIEAARDAEVRAARPKHRRWRDSLPLGWQMDSTPT